MIKDYECVCGKIVEYKKQYKVDFPETIVCDSCGQNMQKRIKKGSLCAIIVPEHMRSSTGFSY